MLHLHLIFVILLALTPTVTPSMHTCGNDEERNEATVEGWPVMVAMRLPGSDQQVRMNLSLTHNDDVHTTIMLTHGMLGPGLLVAKLKSRMVRETLETVTRLPDSAWTTLKIVAIHKELELSIQSESHSVSYSTTTLVNTTDHLHVNTVSCSGSKCGFYIDLKCLYSTRKSYQTKEPKTVSNNTKSTSHKSAYYWALCAVVTLVVMAGLLFLIWRNERKRVMMSRRRSHVVSVKALTPYEDENSSQDDGRDKVKKWQVGINHGHENPAYEE